MSELTDLEICKRIAEIEGVAWMPAYPNQPNEFVGLISENDFCGTPPELIGEFNPLTDKALCFELIEKYQLTIRTGCNLLNNKYKYEVSGEYTDNSEPDINFNTCFNSDADELSRAVCLAIINKDNQS